MLLILLFRVIQRKYMPERLNNSNKVGSFALVACLALLAMLGPFTTDTYFPYFPDMEAHFNISQVQAQQSLTVYLISFTVMMLFHGALSDSFGRKPIIIVALIGFTLTSLGCAMTDSFLWLLIYRAIQGLFVGAGMVVGQAIIRDQFDGVVAQKLIAKVTMLFGLAPAVAPLAGGWMHQYFPWQASFVFLAALGILALAMCFAWLGESLPTEKRVPFKPWQILGNYYEIVTNRHFVNLSLSVGLGFGGFLIYVAGAHDFVFNVLQLTSLDFGWLFIPIVAGLVIGSAVSSASSGKVKNKTLIRIGYAILLSAAFVNVMSSAFTLQSLAWAVIPIFAYTFGLTLILPGVMVMLLDIFPERKGTAASVQAFIQSLVFVLISAMVVPYVLGQGYLYATAMMTMATCSFMLWQRQAYTH
ncbi:multidrug effflux MFS transporter [Methylobacillus pratensis]|uniref:multidrug effflux MFS transporter n=1 Tax=Methylobacillus sp. Pita1 TaxID=3382642 RepID=UPI0038B5C890